MSLLRAVVVGASAAGLAAADGLRDGGWAGTVTVLSAELHAPYDRSCLSKQPLSSHEALDSAALRSPEHFTSQQIDLYLGEWAVGVDIDRRLVVTNNGDGVPYDALIIATGSRPLRMATDSGERLPVLRDLDDLAQLRKLIAPADPVSLIGGGLVGLEVAAALRGRNIPVRVLDSGSTPLNAYMGDDIGRWCLGAHRAHGVDFRTGVKVVGVSGTHGDYRIKLEDGTNHRAETILVGIGAQPAVGWLRGSGVSLGPGVLCDAVGRTSVRDIWAAGDVAAFWDPKTSQRRRFDHWANAVEQGRQVGLNVARKAEDYTPQLRTFSIEQYAQTLHILGTRESGAVDVLVEGSLESGRFVVAHTHGHDVVQAITACGHDGRLGSYRALLARGAPLSDYRRW